MTVTYYGHQLQSERLMMEQLVTSPPPIIAIDTETISLKERLPIGFAIAVSPTEAWWFSSYPEKDSELEMLSGLLQNPAILKVYANVMFDVRVQPLIFQHFQVDETNIVDVLVMARILGHTKAAVGELAVHIGRVAQDAKELLDEYGVSTMLQLPAEVVAAKCANDAMVTLDLYHNFKPQVDAIEGLSDDYMTVESGVVPVLVDMSQRGLAIDEAARAKLELKMESDRDFYRGLCEQHDFNPGSGQQTGYVLAKRGNFLPFTKSRKQLMTNEDTLELVDDPIAAAVLGYKRATSILTKYLYPLRGKDRLYTNYGLDTEVGRTKSSDFNMQNIPAEKSKVGVDVRHIFVPDSGVFTTGDYSQEHLRILMHFSGDREMQQVYYEGKDGGDIHASTAKKIGKPRPIAKAVNFIIPYGKDERVLAQKLRTTNIKWCMELIDDWLDAYPDAAQWLIAAEKYALRTSKALPTLFGRQIAVPEELTKWGKIDTKSMGRKGVNYPILGSDGEVMKRALIICAKKHLPLAVQVHDSITCDGDIVFPISELESLAPVRMPFQVDKGSRWK